MSAPVITPNQSFSGNVGALFSADIEYTNDAYLWVATGLPSWLILDTAQGSLSGTPSAKGNFTVSFRATGAGGVSEFTVVSFTILDGAPLIQAGQIASGAAGVPFSKTFLLTDSGNRAATSWSASGIPSWAQLNTETGLISGQPVEGSYEFFLSAFGPGGADTKSVFIVILSGPPSIEAGQQFSGKVGVPFLQPINASGAPTLWMKVGGVLPEGVSLDAASGVLSGNPVKPGSFSASFTAANQAGSSQSTSISFTIAEGAPLIPAGQVAWVDLGIVFSRSFLATDVSNRPITSWGAVNIPAWASLNSVTGVISGQSREAGSYSFTLTATGPGGVGSAAVTISVGGSGGDDSKIILQKPTFLASESANDIILRGDKCFFARWTGVGGIPPGINWVGMEEGVRFSGTPLRLGEWEAEFEGPYPPNFHSELTKGGSDEPPLQLDAGDIPEQIVVQKFLVRFSVVEQSGYTFGQVLRELVSNPSIYQTARRQAWPGSRCIGMRGISASVIESGVVVERNLNLAFGLEAVASNLAAQINTSMLATATVSGKEIIVTSVEAGQLNITVSSTRQSGISSATSTPGSTTAKQVVKITLSGAFQGGVKYSVSIGDLIYSVVTEAAPKGGLWVYPEAADALDFDRSVSRGIRNYDLSVADYSASDWVFSSSPVISRSLSGCLLTAGVNGASLIDGATRQVAVNAVISV